MLVRYEQTITRFNTQPPEGGWACSLGMAAFSIMFQHTAARRRLGGFMPRLRAHASFQHTAARRRLAKHATSDDIGKTVSTHSRPKAAGHDSNFLLCYSFVFQHTAARRRLGGLRLRGRARCRFQHTAARRRLAKISGRRLNGLGFQHTAARRRLVYYGSFFLPFTDVSTHSRPKAAGVALFGIKSAAFLFQHTAARRRLGCFHAWLRLY